MAEAGRDLQGNKLFSLLRESRWLLLATLAVYFTVALYGYHSADSAWSHSTGITKIENPTGVLGAYLSDLMFYLFGVSAWWWAYAIGSLRGTRCLSYGKSANHLNILRG